MTALRKQKVAQAARDRRDQLRSAVKSVDTIGMPLLVRVRASMPKSYFGAAYDSWVKRQREAAIEVTTRLRAAGFTIEESKSGTTVAFAGIRAVSRLGLERALKSWRWKATAKARSA